MLRLPSIICLSAVSLLIGTAMPAKAQQTSAQTVSGTVEVTGSRANLRSGPGTRYAVVGSVTAGQRLRVLDSRAGWVRIDPATVGLRASEVWVSLQLVEYVAAAPATASEPPPAEPIAPPIPREKPPENVQETPSARPTSASSPARRPARASTSSRTRYGVSLGGVPVVRTNPADGDLSDAVAQLFTPALSLYGSYAVAGISVGAEVELARRSETFEVDGYKVSGSATSSLLMLRGSKPIVLSAFNAEPYVGAGVQSVRFKGTQEGEGSGTFSYLGYVLEPGVMLSRSVSGSAQIFVGAGYRIGFCSSVSDSEEIGDCSESGGLVENASRLFGGPVLKIGMLMAR